MLARARHMIQEHIGMRVCLARSLNCTYSFHLLIAHSFNICLYHQKEMADQVSKNLNHLQDVTSRVLKEQKLLQARCEQLSAELVDHSRNQWQKFLPSSIKETLGILIYDVVADFQS